MGRRLSVLFFPRQQICPGAAGRLLAGDTAALSSVPSLGILSPGEPVPGSHVGSEAAVFLTIPKIRVVFTLLSSWPKCRWAVQRVGRMQCQGASCRCQLQTASKGHQAGRTTTCCMPLLCHGLSPLAL